MVTGGLLQRWLVITHASITLQVLCDSGSELISSNNITFEGVRWNTPTSTLHITSQYVSILILNLIWLKIKSPFNEKPSSSKLIKQPSESQLLFKGEVTLLPVRRCRRASGAQNSLTSHVYLENIIVCTFLFFHFLISLESLSFSLLGFRCGIKCCSGWSPAAVNIFVSFPVLLERMWQRCWEVFVFSAADETRQDVESTFKIKWPVLFLEQPNMAEETLRFKRLSSLSSLSSVSRLSRLSDGSQFNMR